MIEFLRQVKICLFGFNCKFLVYNRSYCGERCRFMQQEICLRSSKLLLEGKYVHQCNLYNQFAISSGFTLILAPKCILRIGMILLCAILSLATLLFFCAYNSHAHTLAWLHYPWSDQIVISWYADPHLCRYNYTDFATRLPLIVALPPILTSLRIISS